MWNGLLYRNGSHVDRLDTFNDYLLKIFSRDLMAFLAAKKPLFNKN